MDRYREQVNAIEAACLILRHQCGLTYEQLREAAKEAVERVVDQLSREADDERFD